MGIHNLYGMSVIFLENRILFFLCVCVCVVTRVTGIPLWLHNYGFVCMCDSKCVDSAVHESNY